MNSRLRRPAVALLATTLAASVLGIAPAAYAADGTVSGTVTGSGAALPDVAVTLYKYDGVDDYWSRVVSNMTDVNGNYSISAAPGQYRVGFDEIDGDFVDEFYVDAAEVEEGTTITLLDGGGFQASADLAPAAHITGQLTGPGAVAVDNHYVIAWREVVVDEGTEDEYTDYNYGGGTFTDEFGAYDLSGLSGGTYRVQFGAPYFSGADYATEYYNNKLTLESADRITVAAAATQGDIDAQLAPDAEISGLVTDATGAPVEDAGVEVLVKVGSEWEYFGYDYTGVDGTYTVSNLPAGAFRVRFDAQIGDDYVSEFWNNVGRLSNATDVVLVENQEVFGINAELVAGEHDAETDPTVMNTALPTISGAPVVGQTLTLTTGSWTPMPTEYYYDWLRNGEFIEGAYGSTYVPTAEDIGKTITVLISAGAPDHDYGYAESAPTAPVAAAAVPPAPVPPAPVPPAPVVDVPAGLAAILANLDTRGKAKVGKTVKVTHIDLVLRTAVTYKFQWFTGTKKIKKATKSKLKITKAMKGKKLSVKVTVKAASTSKSIKLKVGKVK